MLKLSNVRGRVLWSALVRGPRGLHILCRSVPGTIRGPASGGCRRVEGAWQTPACTPLSSLLRLMPMCIRGTAVASNAHVPCAPCWLLLQHWLSARQMRVEGGFQGRSDKLVDGCYSFWQGAAFTIVRQALGDSTGGVRVCVRWVLQGAVVRIVCPTLIVPQPPPLPRLPYRRVAPAPHAVRLPPRLVPQMSGFSIVNVCPSTFCSAARTCEGACSTSLESTSPGAQALC
jgi:hypothetical protein